MKTDSKFLEFHNVLRMGDEKFDDTNHEVNFNWYKLVSNYTSLLYARQGDLPNLKKILLKCPRTLDIENLARAACRFRRKKILEYLLTEFDIDPNKENEMGMTLTFFTIFQIKGVDNQHERSDHGELLQMVVEEHGGNVHHIHKGTGQITVLFHAARNPDQKALCIIRYLVEKHNINLRHRDAFGATVLHFAAMSNNTKTVEYIIKKSGFHSECANWSAVWNSPLYRWAKTHAPEFANLQSWWERKGVLELCENLSPMGVALMHNNTELAARLYGVGCTGILKKDAQKRLDALFEDNYRDFTVICKCCPDAVPELLDCFVKVDTSHSSGFDQTKFFVKKLYGCCAETQTYKTPLATLLQTENTEAFDHKAIKMVVALKWVAFGFKYCKIESRFLIITVMSFFCGFIFDSFQSEVVYALRTLSAAMAIYFLHIEAREAWASPKLSHYILDFWNLLSLATHFLTLTLFMICLVDWFIPGGLESFDTKKRLFSGPGALLLVFSTVQHLKVAPRISRFIALIKLMVKETMEWCILLCVFLAAFSTAMYAVLKSTADMDTGWTFDNVVLYSLRLFATSESVEVYSEDSSLNSLAIFIDIFAIVVVPIIYLNILIAIMAERYEQVSVITETKSIMELAEILVGYESILPLKQRRQYWNAIDSPCYEDPKEVLLQLGLGGDKFTGWLSNGEVTVIQPSGDEFMNIHDHSHMVLLDLKETTHSLKKSLKVQEKRISTLTEQIRRLSKNRRAGFSELVPKVHAYGIQKKASEEDTTNNTSMSHWKALYLDLHQKQTREFSAKKLQAYFRGWQTRAQIKCQFVAPSPRYPYTPGQKSFRGKF